MFLLPSLIALLGSLVAAAPAAAQHFDDCISGTGHSATLILPSTAAATVLGVPLERGSEVAVFTRDGRCAGAAQWTGSSLSLTVWGDDPYQAGELGLAEGDALAFRLWDAATGTEYAGDAVGATYSGAKAFYRRDGRYAADAIYVLESLAVQSTGWDNFGFISTGVAKERESGPGVASYPNPFAGVSTVTFSIPAAAHVRLDVSDMSGKTVALLAGGYHAPGVHEVQLDGSALPSGVYLVRLVAGGESRVVRATLAR